MSTIATVELGGRIIVTSQGTPVCNLEITRGEPVETGHRLILHAMAGDSESEYTDLTITARSIMLGVVPGGDPANGHIYYVSMGGGDMVIAPTKPMRIRPTGDGFVDIWPQHTPGGMNNIEVGAQVPQPGKFTNLMAVGAFSCNGGTLSGPMDVGAAVSGTATDLPSALAVIAELKQLINAMRQAFRVRGDLA